MLYTFHTLWTQELKNASAMVNSDEDLTPLSYFSGPGAPECERCVQFWKEIGTPLALYRPQKAQEDPRRRQEAPEGTKGVKLCLLGPVLQRVLNPLQNQVFRPQTPGPRPWAPDCRPQMGADRRLQITDGSRSSIADREWGVGSNGVAGD